MAEVTKEISTGHRHRHGWLRVWQKGVQIVEDHDLADATCAGFQMNLLGQGALEMGATKWCNRW
jgi:hypothetical protein